MSRSTVWALGLIGVVALFLTISASGEPVVPWLRGTSLEPILLRLGWTNTIVFNLAIGYLVSLMFWILVVHLPERKRRAVLRTSLNRTYQSFKEETVQTLLWASKAPHDTTLVAELASNHVEFKRFFSENNNSRWYAALNGLQSDDERLSEIALALELLSAETSYALGSLPIQDERVHTFLKLLTENIRRLKRYDDDRYDRVKYVGNFIWSILARWSFVDGQRQDDALQSVIDRL